MKFLKGTMCGNDTVQGKQVMECALAASLCTMVLGLTSEHALLQYPGLGPTELHTIFHPHLDEPRAMSTGEWLESV